MYEEYERSSIEAGVSTGMTELVTKEVEEVEQAVKHSSISYFMFKPSSLLTQGIKYNKK